MDKLDYQWNTTNLQDKPLKNLWHLDWNCGCCECLWLDLKSRIWKDQWRPTPRYANHILNMGTTFFCFIPILELNVLLWKKDTCLLLYALVILAVVQYGTPVLIVHTEKAHFKSTRVSLNIKQVQSDTAKPLFTAPRYSLICSLWK